jgi:[ribosomal protein S5]-alanine N-acetyltransferase
MADASIGEVRIYWEKPLEERYQEAQVGPFGDGPRCPVLVTGRLRLRMLRPDDLDFLTELDTDERVVRYIHGGSVSAGSARQYAEAVIESAPRRVDLHRWMIDTAHNCLRIGWIELSKYRQERKRDDLSDDVQLSYQLSPGHWGRGYATEAARAVLEYTFQETRLDRVVAYAHPENVRSVRVIEKLGFLPDGHCTDGVRNVCSFYFLPRQRWRQMQIQQGQGQQ